MLDLGASNDASPKRLFQFGIMGAMLSQYFDDNSHPTIGLLNIGTEEGKGSDSLNEAANLFRRSPLNYIGYVEGNDIYDNVGFLRRYAQSDKKMIKVRNL